MTRQQKGGSSKQFAEDNVQMSEQLKKQQLKGKRTGQTGGTPVDLNVQAQLKDLKMKEAQLNAKLSKYADF